eukprot:4916589-Prymnesium_polylepis.1
MLRSRVRRTAAILAVAPIRRCAAVLLLSRARGLLCACPASALAFQFLRLALATALSGVGPCLLCVLARVFAAFAFGRGVSLVP